MNIWLNKKVKVRERNIEGIVIGYAEYLYARSLVLVSPDITQYPGTEEQWYEIDRVEEVE